MEAMMERRQAPTMLIAPSRPHWERAGEPRVNVYEPSFGLLASDTGWRTTWSAIVAGRFTASLFSGLLFVEHSTAYAELYDTDGQGRLVAPFRRQFSPLGERATWTHVVPGFFGPSEFTGLLFTTAQPASAAFMTVTVKMASSSEVSIPDGARRGAISSQAGSSRPLPTAVSSSTARLKTMAKFGRPTGRASSAMPPIRRFPTSGTRGSLTSWRESFIGRPATSMPFLSLHT
jgi:hypothetical protein